MCFMIIHTLLTLNILTLIGTGNTGSLGHSPIFLPTSIKDTAGNTGNPDGSNRRIPPLANDKKRKIRRKHFLLKMRFVKEV